MDIMHMGIGTRIKNLKSGCVYILGDYVNSEARVLNNNKVPGATDYINKNTQNDYEVIG